MNGQLTDIGFDQALPVRVIFDGWAMFAACPLCPRSRPMRGHSISSVQCQRRTWMLVGNDEAGHLFSISVGQQDVRCCVRKLRIHLISRPTEMWCQDNV